LKHNNPVDLALWESRKLWCSSTTPDVVLSLGTGSEEDAKSPKAPHFRHVFNDGFIPRLCRSFMSSLDGERVWRELRNRLDDNAKADYFRFNIPISEDEARIDGIEQMEELRRYVQLQPSGHDARVKTAVALLTASFFFELEAVPLLESGHYECRGSVRCRNDGQTVIAALFRLLGLHLELSTDTATLGKVSQDDICKACRLYRRKVIVRVRHLEDIVSLYIKYGATERRKISGFPHSMSWFIQQQQLASEFGRENHDSPSRLQCSVCASQRRPDPTRKRKPDRAIVPRKRLRFTVDSTTEANA